eukprot:1528520-Amphidinium_carterae.1
MEYQKQGILFFWRVLGVLITGAWGAIGAGEKQQQSEMMATNSRSQSGLGVLQEWHGNDLRACLQVFKAEGVLKAVEHFSKMGYKVLPAIGAEIISNPL